MSLPGTAVPNGAEMISVAVLPFADMSAAQDQAYFCEGTAEEIIKALVRIEGIRVASRTSSFQVETEGRDASAIGQRLGVRYVLEGSMRKAGSELRINAHVVDVASGLALWSGTFDRELTDIFAIQREIAERTVEALRGVLSERERSDLRRPMTEQYAAYELYLRGRQLLYASGRESTAEAREFYERSLEIDPWYATAWAGLADACSFLDLYYGGGQDGRLRAEEASLRAIELAPDLAETHASRGLALSLRGRYLAAEAEFESALRRDPRLFEALDRWGRVAFSQGNYAAALEHFERAVELRPDESQILTLAAKAMRCMGRQEEALTLHERALALADQRLVLRPTDGRAMGSRACALVELGRIEAGLATADQSREHRSADAMLYYSACAYARAGELDRALDCLEETIEDGWSHWDWLEHDRDLDPVRGSDRFRSLLQDS